MNEPTPLDIHMAKAELATWLCLKTQYVMRIARLLATAREQERAAIAPQEREEHE